jgi:ABC-type antimicrobial peptide transport system permease subunit
MNEFLQASNHLLFFYYLSSNVVYLALLAVCGMATYLPARRALTISPAIALKEP